MDIPVSLCACSASCVGKKFIGLVAWCSATQAVVDRTITHGEGHITELRRSCSCIPGGIRCYGYLPLENIFGGVSKYPHDVL